MVTGRGGAAHTATTLATRSLLELELLGEARRNALAAHLAQQPLALISADDGLRAAYFAATTRLLHAYVDAAHAYLLASGKQVSRDRVYELAYAAFLH